MKKIFVLTIIFFSFNLYAFDKNNISPSEGEYNNNIILDVKNTGSDLYFYFENSISKTPLLYNQKEYPVILSAADGEEKHYKITFLNKTDKSSAITLNYRIDRKKPGSADIKIYDNFLFFNKPEESSSVFFRIDRGNWIEWNGESLRLSDFNTVYYYCVDSSGNKSTVSTWSNQYYRNYRSQKSSLRVFSPEQGMFYNKQKLFIDKTDMEWIRYSFTDKETAVNGTLYTSPFVINRSGDVDIFIAAKPFNSNNLIHDKISFNVIEDSKSLTAELFESGNDKYLKAVSSRIILKAINNKDQFSRYDRPVKLSSDPLRVNYNTVYLKTYDDYSGYCYRYFYLFDERSTSLKNDNEINNTKKITPERPVLEGIKTLSDGSRKIILRQEKNKSFIYSISDIKTAENPEKSSATAENFIVLKNPYGRDSNYSVKVCTADEYGIISEPLVINNLSVDHYPPEIPEIIIQDNLIEFKSKYDVFYRFIREDIKSGNYLKYTKAFRIETIPGILENISVEYFSLDKHENKSMPGLKKLVFDNRYPDIVDSGFLKKENLSSSSFNVLKDFFKHDYEIYYTLSENLIPPRDPDINSKKLTSNLVLDCADGEEKYYTMKILPVSSVNSNRGNIQIFYFHIDKIKPEIPQIHHLKSVYYSDNAVIRLKGTESGNTVYYSYSSDKNSIDSPFNGTRASDNTIVIPLPEKDRKTVYLKTASQDRAGNRSAESDIISFVIDNRNYPEITFDSLTENYITPDNVVINKPSNNFIYRYEISNTEKSLPAVNSYSSVMESPVAFDMNSGEEKAFYIAVKAYFDINDNKGSEEKIFRIFIDKKKPEKPAITIKDNNKIHISGENTVLYTAYPEKTGIINPEYKKYIKPFMLNRYLPPGRYIIKAYSRDKAGNLSDASEDSFYISGKAVYVSHSKGNDKNKGTDSDYPVKTLDRAFDIYRNGEVDTFFLMPGNYEINNKVQAQQTLLIKGTSGKTFITDKSPGAASLFSLNDSSLILKDITMISKIYKNTFINAENSLVVFDNSEIKINCSTSVNAKNSTTIIENTDLTQETVFYSRPLVSDYGHLKIKDSNLDIISASEITSLNCNRSTADISDSSFLLNSDNSLFSKSVNSSLKNSNVRVKIISGVNSYFFQVGKGSYTDP